VDLSEALQIVDKINAASSALILNSQNSVKLLLTAILSSSHVILKGAPGTGKTLLIKNISSILGLQRRSIHCTSESQASDLSQILQPLSDGQILCNVLSIDEINRASFGFQSHLLELMEDGFFSFERTKYYTKLPFTVIATQTNDYSSDSFALSKSQLDRFGMIIPLSSPNVDELMVMLSDDYESMITTNALCDIEQLKCIQAYCQSVNVSKKQVGLIANLVVATSPEANTAPDIVKRYVKHGAGVRAARALLQTSKALAFINGRTEVMADDIFTLLEPVLAHRLVLNFSGFANAVASQSILEAVKQRFF